MLRQTVERYLAIRSVAGFELKVDAGLLRNFARFSMDRSETCVRRQTAIDWAAKAPSPSQQERRLGMVRRFAEHARAEDPGHEIVPRNVFASRSPANAAGHSPTFSHRRNCLSFLMPPLTSDPEVP